MDNENLLLICDISRTVGDSIILPLNIYSNLFEFPIGRVVLWRIIEEIVIFRGLDSLIERPGDIE